MSLGNSFTKHDGSWRVVGPCIDAGDCIGDYVEVHTSGGSKEVLITNIETVKVAHPFTRKIREVKMGVPASKKEEAEYCGADYDYDFEELHRWDEYPH